MLKYNIVLNCAPGKRTSEIFSDKKKYITLIVIKIFLVWSIKLVIGEYFGKIKICLRFSKNKTKLVKYMSIELIEDIIIIVYIITENKVKLSSLPRSKIIFKNNVFPSIIF